MHAEKIGAREPWSLVNLRFDESRQRAVVCVLARVEKVAELPPGHAWLHGLGKPPCRLPLRFPPKMIHPLSNFTNMHCIPDEPDIQGSKMEYRDMHSLLEPSEGSICTKGTQPLW